MGSLWLLDIYMRLYDNIAPTLASGVMYPYYLLKLDRTVYFLSFHATDGVAMGPTKISPR